MKELINKLREQAQKNINEGEYPCDASWGYEEGVLITNQQAMDIVEKLDVAMYPPIVKCVLAILTHMNDAIKHQFACVDKDGEGSCCKEKPILAKTFWGDVANNMYFFNFNELLCIEKDKHIWKTLLFQRTENGWKWIGKPENQK